MLFRSMKLEQASNRLLINSTSNYEFEIRLIENKEGQLNGLIKLNTIKDERFLYREQFISTSIKPVNAALLVQLAKPYMVEDAQVLDPFCGVGTMLIERQKIVKANTSYGIDHSEEAIEKAKINTQLAGQIIHYVHKNSLEFTHAYQFDEIFTNMPYATMHITKESIQKLYEDFFAHAKTLLKKEGIIIMYTHDKEYAHTYSKANGFVTLKS